MADTPPKLEGKKVEQVKKLVALAASSTLEEAKNAAYKACQLIRTLRLDIIDPDDVNVILQKLALTETKVRQLEAGGVPFDADAVNDRFHGLRNAASAAKTPYDPSFANIFGGGGAYQSPGAPKQAPPKQAPVDSDPMGTPVSLKDGARYPGKCLHCGKQISVGGAARWVKNVGMWCDLPAVCYRDWKMGQTAAPFTGTDFTDLFTK